TVDQVIAVLNANAEKARRLVARVAPKLGPERAPSPLGIEHVLDTACITARDWRDRELFAKLDAVAGRVLNKVLFSWISKPLFARFRIIRSQELFSATSPRCWGIRVLF